MPRYIDADELVQRFNKQTDSIASALTTDAEDFRIFCLIADAVEYMPTADVEPVKHAHWITTSDGYTRCSRCRRAMAYADIHGVHKLDTKMLTYCFRCGAKIEGSKKVEE